MRVQQWRILVGCGAIAGITAAGAGVAGQAPAPAPASPTHGVLTELMTEVRGLRAAMEQAAVSGPRVQLALGRLQMQEQRIEATLRRLESVRTRLQMAERQHEESREQLKMMEEAARTGPVGDASPADVEQMLFHLKRNITRAASDVRRLQVEEADLAGSLAAEQARWTDINQRLEGLEGSLIRR